MIHTACPLNTYKTHPRPGGIETCNACPDEHMYSAEASISIQNCTCFEGYRKVISIFLSYSQNSIRILSISFVWLTFLKTAHYWINLIQVDNGTRCEQITCGEFEIPENSHYQFYSCDDSALSSCQFVCDEGYDMKGTNRISCNLAGQWEASDGGPIQTPECISK